MPNIEHVFSLIWVIFFILQRIGLQGAGVEPQTVQHRAQFHDGNSRDAEAPDRVGAPQSAACSPPMSPIIQAEPVDCNLLHVTAELTLPRSASHIDLPQ